MYIYKMLLINRFREYKRLISNLFIPVITVLIGAVWLGWVSIPYIILHLNNIRTVNREGLHFIEAALAVYSACSCLYHVKPLIVMKPMSLHLFSEAQTAKMLRLKYLGISFKNFIAALFLTAFTGGIHRNMELFIIAANLFLFLEITSNLKWWSYHKEKAVIGRVVIFLTVSFLALHFSDRIYLAAMANAILWLITFYHAFGHMELNRIKYWDEMLLAEKVLSAQNHNNTVLLNSYAKEKSLRRISGTRKMLKLWRKYPLVWKSGLSVFRLERTRIVGAVLISLACFAGYMMPCFWTLPFLEIKEMRYLLLFWGMLILYQLPIQCMLHQMGGLIDKAKDGLFLPLTKRGIFLQFTIIPVVVVFVLDMIAAAILKSGFMKFMILAFLMAGLTAGIFYLELTRKDFLRKVYFLINILMLGIAIFMG